MKFSLQNCVIPVLCLKQDFSDDPVVNNPCGAGDTGSYLVGGLRACRPQLERACHSLQRARVGPQPRAAHVPKLRPNAAENKYILLKNRAIHKSVLRVSNFSLG